MFIVRTQDVREAHNVGEIVEAYCKGNTTVLPEWVRELLSSREIVVTWDKTLLLPWGLTTELSGEMFLVRPAKKLDAPSYFSPSEIHIYYHRVQILPKEDEE